jgi:hypothetical protein
VKRRKDFFGPQRHPAFAELDRAAHAESCRSGQGRAWGDGGAEVATHRLVDGRDFGLVEASFIGLDCEPRIECPGLTVTSSP